MLSSLILLTSKNKELSMADVLECPKCGKQFSGRLAIGTDIHSKNDKLYCPCGGALAVTTIGEGLVEPEKVPEVLLEDEDNGEN